MMIASILLASVAADPGSHFVGDWTCTSAFVNDPLKIDLTVRTIGDVTTAELSNSSDKRLPNGSIKPVGKAWKIEKKYRWEKASEIMADAQQHFHVKNAVGSVDFIMLWDMQDGVSVNLWQYFDDGSPSRMMGGLKCVEKTA